MEAEATDTVTVFKITTAPELEERLPPFETCSLEDAVDAVANLLAGLQSRADIEARHAYAAQHIRESLLHVFAESTLANPLETLCNIRTWALDGLRNEPLRDKLSKPLEITAASESLSFPHYETATCSFSPQEARSVLANAFLGNCNDTMAERKDRWNQGGLDFLPMLMRCKHKSVGLEKMKCVLFYFDSASKDIGESTRQVVFELVQFVPLNLKDGKALEGICGRNVGDGIVLHNNSMEHPPRGCSGFVNFANSNFGYGKFIASCTQEEILLSCCPEVCVGMLLLGRMKSNEIVLVHGAQRYVEHSGYSNSFVCKGPVASPCPQSILTMDACHGDHFATSSIERDISKAYYAFRALVDYDCGDTAFPVISTGKWGCGIFGGLAIHKFLQQVVAANLAGVDLDFSSFGDDEGCSTLLETLQTNECKATQVLHALQVCKDPRSFAKDVLSLLSARAETSTEICVIS